jgi:WD40 repeat protein
MKDHSRYLALVLLIVGLCHPASPQSSCPAISIPQPAPGANIFSSHQEAVLGDAIDAGMRQTMHMAQDKVLMQPLTAIANRLEAQMPPDHPQFRVVLFDSTSAGAFSIPGHIYVSRKLIALTRSEDEMAGILAHEMGHLLANHSAITASENFRRVLQVSQVGDDADVAAKWNDYLSNYMRVKYTGTDAARAQKAENQHQEQADNIALSLVAKAGYSTQAFVEVFDRIAETRGKTGNAWTDLFGDTTPDSKRLRQLAKDRPPLPADCILAHGSSVPDYAAWRAKVIEHGSEAHNTSVSGLISQRPLTERLRPQVSHIRVSPDGKYIIAQDDSNLFVLTRSPLKSVLRLDAPEASAAQFTPDSTGIVFQFAPAGSSPRVEHWDIASNKRLDVHEIYVRRGCLLSTLSPDGKTLACLNQGTVNIGYSLDLDLFDTASGNSFFHKKDWVFVNSQLANYFVLLRVSLGIVAAGDEDLYDQVSRVVFSPDGRYLVARSITNTFAMDLISRTPLNLHGNVRELLDLGRFTFLSDGRFAGVTGSRADKVNVLEFPSGQVVYKDVLVGGAKISRVARGDFLFLRPIKDSPLGAVNLKDGKVFFQSKRSAFDIWDSQGFGERENGDLIVLDLATAKVVESVALTEARLGSVRAAVSPDLNWLAVSQNSRGAVWNVQSGQRSYHVRGYRGAYFSPSGTLIADFPKYLKTERTIVEMSLSQESFQSKYTLDEKEQSVQIGRYLLTLTAADAGSDLNRNVTFQVSDVANHSLLWSKHIGQERPGYFTDSASNSLVLYWQAGSKEIQSLIKQDPEAAAHLAPFKSREGIDYVEVLDLDTGKRRFAMAIDTGKNSIRVAEMVASSDRLVVADNSNRLLIFGSNGAQIGTLMGSRPAISRSSNLLTAHTQSSELTLYDLQTLQPRAVHNFDSRVVYNAFSADGNRLLVLSSNQIIYVLDTAAQKSLSGN